MLITLFAWLYITFLCRTWGNGILYCLKKLTGNKNEITLSLSITCLLGLAAVTTFASILSLLMPLGGLATQILIFLPCLLFFFQKKQKFILFSIKTELSGLHISVIFLFFCFLLMILLMSSWTINHPDTLGYHAQTIQWIEKYKAVPGLVHLHIRYGYQGLWFVSCAIFSFKFFNSTALTFINSTILIWYFIFIMQKINENIFRKNNLTNGALWIALAALSIWSYTQVRLTATSASPDFIASLFIWMIFLLLLEKNPDERPSSFWLLIILFSFFAFTIKLSAFPVIIIAGYALFRIIQQKKVWQFITAILIAILILFPFIARNIISSGYVVFPSIYPDIVKVDWKLDKARTQLEKSYISAYARSPVDRNDKEIEASLNMNLNEWLPSWWKNRSLSDKVYIVLFIVAFISFFIKFKNVFRSKAITWVAIVTSLAGCIFWFIQAPDLRFGFGFIVAFPAIMISIFLTNKENRPLVSFKKSMIGLITILGLALMGYSFYRVTHFFSPEQIIQPLGIAHTPSSIIKCNDIEFRIPKHNVACASIDIPCVYDSCQTFQLRGKKIEDGFRSK